MTGIMYLPKTMLQTLLLDITLLQNCWHLISSVGLSFLKSLVVQHIQSPRVILSKSYPKRRARNVYSSQSLQIHSPCLFSTFSGGWTISQNSLLLLYMFWNLSEKWSPSDSSEALILLPSPSHPHENRLSIFSFEKLRGKPIQMLSTIFCLENLCLKALIFATCHQF